MSELVLVTTGPEGEQVYPLTGILQVGRGEGNEVQLRSAGISRQHARFTKEPEGIRVEDLQSANGVYVNGERVATARLKPGDQIRIGPRVFTVVEATHAAAGSGTSRQPGADQGGMHDGQIWVFKQQVRAALVQRMDLKRTQVEIAEDTALRAQVVAMVAEIVADRRTELPSDADPAVLIQDVVDEAIGLGPLEAFLADPEVDEVMVNGCERIYIERHGRLELTAKRFADDEQVKAVIDRIVGPLGRRIDESSPLVDARLPDGSRVNAIIPPLSLKGPILTIRKFSSRPLVVDDLIRLGTINEVLAGFFRLCIQTRQNLVISGGTGCGKTTLLNVLASYVMPDERIVTIEDAAELRLPQAHVVPLEARPPNIEGKGAVTIRDLVRNALRMRPDRIIVGECRGGEALDMLQAMNTGHDGSMTTLHANSPRDALARLETMVLMAGMDLPVRAIREQIASAIQIIIQQSRMPDGSRKVTHVTEVTGMEGGTISLQDLYVYQRGAARHTATGLTPRFVERLQAQHVEVPLHLFQ